MGIFDMSLAEGNRLTARVKELEEKHNALVESHSRLWDLVEKMYGVVQIKPAKKAKKRGS